MIRKLLTLATFVAASIFAQAATVEIANAQASNCSVSASAPTYAAGTLKPLSCDTSGGLRTSGGSSGGATDLTEIGGNAVTVTTPGVLDVNVVSSAAGGAVDVTDIGGVPVVSTTPGTFDVTCIAGCAAPVGTSDVNLVEIGGNALTTTVPISGTLTAVTAITNALPAGTNNIGDVDVLSLPAIPAGTNNIGDVDAIQSGTWTVQPGNTANTTPWLVTPIPPTTTADTLLSSAILANSTNSTLVKNGAGTLYNVSVTNNSATLAYLKLYNSASAPTCGSGTPVARYIIPASTAGAGSNIDIAVGAEFTTGIGYCVTTGITDADTTAVAANAYIVNIVYK